MFYVPRQNSSNYSCRATEMPMQRALYYFFRMLKWSTTKKVQNSRQKVRDKHVPNARPSRFQYHLLLHLKRSFVTANFNEF